MAPSTSRYIQSSNNSEFSKYMNLTKSTFMSIFLMRLTIASHIQQNSLTILTYGPTRAGKSSFINTLAGYNLVEVGSDDYESTTRDVKLI